MKLLKIICIYLFVGMLQCGPNTAAEAVAKVLSKAILNALKDPTKYCQEMKYDWTEEDFPVLSISMVPTSDNNLEWVAVVDTETFGMMVITTSNGPCGLWTKRSKINIPGKPSHGTNNSPYLYRYKDAPDSMPQYWLAYIWSHNIWLCGFKDLATLTSEGQPQGVYFY